MDWILFPNYAITSLVLWSLSIILFAIPSKNRLLDNIAVMLSVVGVIVIGLFITMLWIHLERPPLRTLGETRVWYSLFISAVGITTYIRWRSSQTKNLTKIIFRLFIMFELLMAIVFIIINLIHPENYDKALMPALQSPWFVPHVIVYILSYALLGLSSVVAIVGLVIFYRKNFDEDVLKLADNLVYIGMFMLIAGGVYLFWIGSEKKDNIENTK